jgi:hypothetical protein
MTSPTIPDEFTFSVAQSQIDRGVKGDSCRCPLALAILIALRLETGVAVIAVKRTKEVFVKIYDGVRYHVFTLPSECCAAVAAFDAGKGMKPATYKAVRDRKRF